ncbi:LCP family protein [Enterococcus sp. C76]|uniref:LCP family glycopolymer transferase n=1 Tax=Enterococcus sp. C76 TaxID=3231334 RepID=UPI0019FDDF93|nr:transcriptional regulator [Enterococcus faecium]EME3554970.1 LCP family protein [Enterococcus faecium]
MKKHQRKNLSHTKQHQKNIFHAFLSIVLVLLFIIMAIGVMIVHDIKRTNEKIYEPIPETVASSQVKLNQKEPFSVLLLGIDTGALGRTDQGRSDTIIVATVNPMKKKTVLVSLPRDSYVDIVGHNTQDKLNHAYAFGGIPMIIHTVENLLDIPIDYYLAINMKGIESLVDTVGGVKVNNPFTFTYGGEKFPIGIQYLDGQEALKYTRMRYDDPQGDYGRQDRQRQVVTAILKKVISIKGIVHYQKIMDSLDNNVKTDISTENIETLIKGYRSAFTKIESKQVKGEEFVQDGISYQRILPNELKSIQTLIKEQLNKGTT